LPIPHVQCEGHTLSRTVCSSSGNLERSQVKLFLYTTYVLHGRLSQTMLLVTQPSFTSSHIYPFLTTSTVGYSISFQIVSVSPDLTLFPLPYWASTSVWSKVRPLAHRFSSSTHPIYQVLHPKMHLSSMEMMTKRVEPVIECGHAFSAPSILQIKIL